MKQLVGAILESTDGKLLLQLRDNKPEISSPGKITLFGGHPEGDEDLITTLQRELLEELELKVEASNAVLFCTLDSKFTQEVRSIFLIKGVERKKLELHEGQAIIEVSRSDNLKQINLSAITRAILSLYWQDIEF